MNAQDCYKIIRDIPYKIPTKREEADHCCIGKHRVLINALHSMDIQVRPAMCEFAWSDIKSIPKRIIEIPHEDYISHTYLEIKELGKWRVLDATWDIALKNILPVNEYSESIIAVPVTKILSPKKSQGLFYRNEDFDQDMAQSGEFYEAFNLWLEKERKI